MIRFVTLLVVCSVASAEEVVTRIKGGTTAAPGEFPYQVSVQINGQHVCGGALVTSRHVVTAASCLESLLRNRSLLERTRILAGTNSLRKDGVYYGIRGVSIHPQYQYNTQYVSFTNDISVIHLQGDVDNRIRPVALPSVMEIPPNTGFFFTGWGSVSQPNGPSVELLQKAQLSSISKADCQKYLPNVRIEDYQLCTSPNYYVGTCTTDSGSPLVYNNQLYGISTGLHGCALGTPDVFTKVAYYTKFIIDEVNSRK